MKKHLYDSIASRWLKDGGTVWFYSDPHFNDPDMTGKRVCYHTDEEQIKNINSVVRKIDTIVFLGDIGDVKCIQKIRGYKVLIMGNHDRGASYYQRIRQDVYPCPICGSHDTRATARAFEGNGCSGSVVHRICHDCGFEEGPESGWCEKVTLDNHLFDEVYEGPLMISDRIILSHEPIFPLPPYMFNIHGHFHLPCEAPADTDPGMVEAQGLNLCAERTGYLPISLSWVVKSGFLGSTENIHQYTINKRLGRI